MSKISLTFGETKSKVNLALEDRDVGLTWDEATMTWDEATGTWDNPKRPITKESKSKISLSMESK